MDHQPVGPDLLRRRAPLVHVITNYVTANDCANLLLAAGASPIMADDPLESAEITAACSSLVLNLGTLSPRRADAMLCAAKKANLLGHPVIFDPVGVGASAFRRETAQRLFQETTFTAIRGNYSEIRCLAGGGAENHGVDAAKKGADSLTLLPLMRQLSHKTGAVIIATGKEDFVVFGNLSAVIRNGHPIMSRITGSGCMLSALLGAYLGAAPAAPLEASVAAVSVMGLCGELAHQKNANMGTASFRIALLDQMSQMDDILWNGGKQIEFF